MKSKVGAGYRQDIRAIEAEWALRGLLRLIRDHFTMLEIGKVPGVSDFAAEKHPSSRTDSPPEWMADLENDDINLLQEFGSLTTSQLMEKVRGLQNLAYQLGLDEAREMTRGKFLQILQRSKKH